MEGEKIYATKLRTKIKLKR